MENRDTRNTEDAEFETAAETPTGPSRQERQWAMGCHLIALVGLLLPFPSLHLVAPLVLWLVKRDDGVFVDDQGKESVNFQISMLIYLMGCVLLMTVGIGLLLIGPLVIFWLVCVVIASIKASDGISFRYPLCIRLIK